MTKSNNYIFTSSGCLTASALEDLARGVLSGDTLLIAEAHIAECDFCSDSLDGVKVWLGNVTIKSQGIQSRPGTFVDRTIKLNNKVKEQLLTQTDPLPSEKIRRIPLLYRWVAAAALLFIFAGIYFLVSRKPYLEQNTLALEKQINANSDHPTSVPTETKNRETLNFENNKAAPVKIRSTIQFTPPVIKKDEEVRKDEQLSTEIQSNPNDVTSRNDKWKEVSVTDAQDITDPVALKEIRKEVLNPTPSTSVDSPNTISDSKKTTAIQQDELMSPAVNEVNPAGHEEISNHSITKNVTAGEIYRKPYSIAEEMPEFPGGEVKLKQFLANNIKYPKQALESAITGTVYLTFVVEQSGKITNVRILRGIGGGCDEEAIRVINLMPKWLPGKQNGKTIPVQFNLPIQFALPQ